MRRVYWTFAVGMLLTTPASVNAQVVSGVLSVTQTHMA